MKTYVMALVLLSSAVWARGAEGALKEKAREVADAFRDSVLFVTAVTEVEFSAGDSRVRKEERKVEALGTVISADGLIVVPLSSLDPATAMDGRTLNGPKGPMKLSAKGTTKEVKLLLPDGSEMEAKVTFKDPDLDLAFVRVNDGDAGLTAIRMEDYAEMNVLDDVIVLGRLGKGLNREPVVLTSEVISVIRKPRRFGKVNAQSLGMPVFNGDGKFVGLGVNRFSSTGVREGGVPAPVSVVLPAEDLLETASQVK